MTPETQPQAAAPGGFARYDDFSGPDLDAARWAPVHLPLPTGGEHIPLDPNAELAVDAGEVRVMISRFSLSHDTLLSPSTASNTSPCRRTSSSCRPIGPRRSPPTSRSTTSAGIRRISVVGSRPFRSATSI